MDCRPAYDETSRWLAAAFTARLASLHSNSKARHG